MIDKTLFLIWAIWYFNRYGIHPILLNFLVNFYYLYNDFFIYYNKLLYPEYWSDTESELSDINENKIEIVNESIKKPPKYENKYLEDIRSLNKEWIFTEEENNEIPQLIQLFLNASIENRQNKINEIIGEIKSLNDEILQDIDTPSYCEDLDSEGDILIHELTLEERNTKRKCEIIEHEVKIQIIKDEFETDLGIEKLKIEAQNEAEKYIINKRLDKLKNCYVIEKTPIGNVLMIYENDRESFKYYSDCNIPYRYLEVVGRKYVKLFGCRPIYIDMEEELRLFEEKWEKEQEIRKLKEEEKRKAEETTKNSTQIETKKNVFAKFKSYNKDAGGKISMAAPPKNSIPNKSVTENKENEKILLKERANRYTYEGKFANFNFLQKIERKVFNKKLGLSFSDFKKMAK